MVDTSRNMIRWAKAITLISISLCTVHSSLAALENQSTVSSTSEDHRCASTTEHHQNLELMQEIYGVDVSFPMHYQSIRHGIQPLGDRQKFYDEFLNGCRQHAKEYASGCDETEADRIENNLIQPAFMVNFTENGYKKIRAPEPLFQIIKEFWAKNRHNETKEAWSIGETVTNHWVNPSFMLNIGDPIHEGGGTELYDAIADAARLSIQEWTGMELTSTSVYGIRIYKEGSVLAPHVDRLPLISSAIINVDQDVDEPWPLEVIGHDGVAENVTMLPGDLVLYESHSVIHGRPYPLKGRFFANIFIHFKPIASRENVALPYYIIPNSTEAEEWFNERGLSMLSQHSTLIDEVDPSEEESTEENIEESVELYGRHRAHVAAIEEDLVTLHELVKVDSKEVFTYVDDNGWTPLHEAARTLNLEIVQFIVDHGADVDARNLEDETALDVAVFFGGDDHPVTLFLQGLRDEIDDSDQEL